MVLNSVALPWATEVQMDKAPAEQPMDDEPILFLGHTDWADAPHFPCRNQVTCPNEPGNLPRPGSDSTLFGIRHHDRMRHTLLLGQTGQGKSTLLRNMILQDMVAGHGLALIDPHGDLAASLLSSIPPSRTRSVVYFDPSDLAYPIGLNVFDAVDPEWHFLVADQLIAVFRNIWHNSWGPRMEHIFHSTVLSLLHVEGSTLLGVPRLLTDKPYREWVVSKLSDPLLRRFWTHEYEPLNAAHQREVISPILNKVGQFLMAPPIRHIVGQVRTKLDCDRLMDDSGIFIANLSKGRIGEHNARLLGSLLITKFFLSALRRADRPEHARVDFFLTADEIHNLSSDMLGDLLSEARKYRLAFTGATQYLGQLSPAVRSAIFGNVGTTIAFRVGPEDAQLLESSFAPHCQPTDLQTTVQHEFFIKLAINGAGVTWPFHANALPPLTPRYATQDPERIIRASRERYAARRSDVETAIHRWLAQKGPISDQASKTSKAATQPPPWWGG
jgi:hypothetical protein